MFLFYNAKSLSNYSRLGIKVGPGFMYSLTIGHFSKWWASWSTPHFPRAENCYYHGNAPYRVEGGKKDVIFGWNWSISKLDSNRKPIDLLQMCFTTELESPWFIPSQPHFSPIWLTPMGTYKYFSLEKKNSERLSKSIYKEIFMTVFNTLI